MIRYLRLGALAGIGGGLALAAFLLVVGEGPINQAVQLEEAAAHGGGDALFTRAQQEIGGAIGSIFLGAALGAIFGVVFAATRHRLPGRTDLHRALWLAAASFVSLALVPALKYPANPPAVGDPATVDLRTGLYLFLMAASVLAVVLAARTAIWLRDRSVSDTVALVVPVLVWLSVVALALVVFPAPDVTIDLAADLVWRFRLASLGGTLTLWAVTGTLFGWLLLRADADDRDQKLTVLVCEPGDSASQGEPSPLRNLPEIWRSH